MNAAPIPASRRVPRTRRLSLGLGGSLGFQGGGSDLEQFRKSGGVRGGHVSKNFTVQRAVGGFQALDEAAVGGAGGAGGGIDADLPQGAKIPFFCLTIAEGVLAAMVHGVGGVAVKFRAPHPEALGGSEHSGSALSGSGGVGDAHGIIRES